MAIRDDTNAKSEEGQLAKEILIKFMEDFQKRNPNLYVFSAHLHMDEETPPRKSIFKNI